MNIVVTGASNGLGLEIVLELLRNKENKVVAVSRDSAKLKKLLEIAKGLSPECTLIPVGFDIATQDINLLEEFILKSVGTVDVLINNAGQMVRKPFMKTTDQEMLQMLDNNIFSHFRMSKAVVPLMLNGGHIVNIGSMWALNGTEKRENLSAFTASKAALHSLTESMALELAQYNVKVNCLAIGTVQTETFETHFPEEESLTMAFELGAHIASFALNASKFYNGKVIPLSI